MNAAAVIPFLAIPADARVDQRVPKKLLVEQGAPTAADKRNIQEGIEELLWIAALKANNIGVPAYRDDVREYLEIAVLIATLRPEAKVARLTELIHRAIPYPLVLITVQVEEIALSLAHKRWSQAESGKVVVEGKISIAALNRGNGVDAFLNSIALVMQPTQNLFQLYQGWIERIDALVAASITGHFVSVFTPEAATARREALDDYARIQQEIVSLRAQAENERQMSRRVELNLAIQKLEARLGELSTRI